MITIGKGHKIWRQSREPLGGKFGKDKHRHLVVGFIEPDLLVCYPKGTRARVTIDIKQAYFHALYALAIHQHLERARKRKQLLRERRERRRIQAAEHRFKKSLS